MVIVGLCFEIYVNSYNSRNLQSQLYIDFVSMFKMIAVVKQMKEQAIIRSVCPEFSRLQAKYNGRYKQQYRNIEVIYKNDLSMDRRLKLIFLKMEIIVIVIKEITVNHTLFNAHIARQVTQI